jgi:NADPH:quinone reductase-like Zn-dependent oxidoreductase
MELIDNHTDASADVRRDSGRESPEAGAEMMRAIVQDRYGTVDQWRLAQTTTPDIAPNEVLVKVRAVGLDRGTWHLMTGRAYLIRLLGFGLLRPKHRVPGLDMAGVVVAVGADVTRFKAGDEVFGISRGSFAEYAAAREEKLAHKPTNLSFTQAAVVPISGSTALQAVRAAHVEAGQQVLVIGASGGVGTYAVQLAKAAGAQVTGVCSTSKIDLVRSLGADRVIDYTQSDFADGSQRYDVIIDIGGNSRLARLRRALTPTGTLVIVGGEQGGSVTGGFGRQLRAPVVSLFVSQRLAMLASKEHHSYLDALRPLIETGEVTPALDRTYPLPDAPDAMRRLEAGHARAKIAITI